MELADALRHTIQLCGPGERAATEWCTNVGFLVNQSGVIYLGYLRRSRVCSVEDADVDQSVIY